ncbi:hypothetical protein FO519_004395 [Halicephalobus sp. NKZ332]|nr:hypothetical protein FO519_004395 [Halicephalobus sp. NKZ332]
MSSGDSDSTAREAVKRAGSSDSDESCISKKSRSNPLTDEIDLEPYVRRRKAESDKTKMRMMKLDPEEQDRLRQCINSRERKRMHNLNSALDKLRTTLPYSKSPNTRKLSKINTIIAAAEWITQLTSENSSLRSQVGDLGGQAPPPLKLNPIKQECSSPTPSSPAETKSTQSTPRSSLPLPPDPSPQIPPGALMAMFPQFFQQQNSLASFAAFLPPRFPGPSHICLKKLQNV